MSVIFGFVWNLIRTNIFLLIHRNRSNKFSLRSPFPAREGSAVAALCGRDGVATLDSRGRRPLQFKR